MNLGLWIILYMLITVVIGILASRFIHSSADFLSTSRRLPLLFNASALFAFWFGSETVLGASSEFIQHGLLGVIEDPFGGFLCLVLFGLIFVRPLYRKNILTLGDLFRGVYGARVERISSLLMILAFFGYAAAQIIALGILFHTIFGLDELTGRLLSAAIVMVYTTAGGMWSVSITDFIQSIMIVVGLVFIAIFLFGQVDVSTLFHSKDPYFFDFLPNRHPDVSWMDYFAAWCALGLGSLASQDIFQRANAARTERIAVSSTYLGAGLYLIFAMIPLLLGLMVFQLHPELTTDNTQHALTTMISNYTPMWLQVLFYGALTSAIFSTCSGALLAPSSLLAENVLKPLFYPNSPDKQLLRLSRISVVVITIIATVLAVTSESIYALVSQSSILGMVSILVPLYAALFYKERQRPLGALLSMTFGLGVYVVFEIFPFEPVPSMFFGFGASVLGLFIGNSISRKDAENAKVA
ncbi:MAG: sodium:solute symporter family protein [Bacteroidota bacterium]